MQVNSTPQVIHTLPKAYSVDLDVNSLKSIKLGFNTDIDVNSLEGNVVVYDEQDALVQGKIDYQNRILTFTFKDKLKSSHTYRIVVKGDQEAFVKGLDDGDGIRSVMGVYMAKDYDYTLSTMGVDIPTPSIKTPSHFSSIKEQPIFSWTAIKDADEYELEVSKSNRFRPLAIPEGGLEGIKLSDTSFQWKETLPDGTYYVQVRARMGEYWGSWSKTTQFNIDTVEEGLVSEGDSDLTDDDIETFEQMVEIVDMSPQDLSSQISTYLPGIAVRVLGELNATDIQINVVGVPLDNEDDEQFYEKVDGKISLRTNDDGTTWAIFKPSPLEEGDN